MGAVLQELLRSVEKGIVFLYFCFSVRPIEKNVVRLTKSDILRLVILRFVLRKHAAPA